MTRRNGRVAITGNSAHWANRADVGIVIHREGDGETLIRVAKVRYQDQIGSPGDVTARYVWQRCTYEAAASKAEEPAEETRNWSDD